MLAQIALKSCQLQNIDYLDIFIINIVITWIKKSNLIWNFVDYFEIKQKVLRLMLRECMKPKMPTQILFFFLLKHLKTFSVQIQCIMHIPHLHLVKSNHSHKNNTGTNCRCTLCALLNVGGCLAAVFESNTTYSSSTLNKSCIIII